MSEHTSVPAKTEPATPAPAGGRAGRRPANLTMFEEMQSDLAQFLAGGPFGLAMPMSARFRAGMTAMPRVDVFERNGNLVVKAELPGVKQEDVDLTIEDGDLVLRAEQRSEHEVREENWYRMERQSGSLYRRLPLPERIEPGKIDATLKDGILEVVIPKAKQAEPTPHRIAIR